MQRAETDDAEKHLEEYAEDVWLREHERQDAYESGPDTVTYRRPNFRQSFLQASPGSLVDILQHEEMPGMCNGGT